VASEGSNNLRLALAQIDSIVGDINGNRDRIIRLVREAEEQTVDLLLFPELAITGYPPEDLLYKSHFVSDAYTAIEQIAKYVKNTTCIVGFPEGEGTLYNSAAVLQDGKVSSIYRKQHLPNYAVFDECRYFQAGAKQKLIDVKGVTTAVTICEDLWVPHISHGSEGLPQADLIVNISASPYHQGKGAERLKLFSQRAVQNKSAVAFCNMVGAQDELVFDGQSMVIAPDGNLLARLGQFKEELKTVDLSFNDSSVSTENTATDQLIAEPLAATAELHAALCTGLRDYVNKNGFDSVLIGVSGGIDSAVVATLATDALGSERVKAATMPSQYSSEATYQDAYLLAKNLDIEITDLPITDLMRSYESTLTTAFSGTTADTTEENLQARIRGTLLMALSNKFGHLVLMASNKSELAVGYSTLYGDAVGGYAPIKDCLKGTVYELAEYCNSIRELPAIPSSIVNREPSAELRPDQRDQDTLPAYELLDPIVTAYLEGNRNQEKLVSKQLPLASVEKIFKLIHRAEYKRRQSPIGTKVTKRSFGRDYRSPITNLYLN